jgi:hypothetical protein
LINETKTFHQINNTQKKKSPNKPMITIAMETLKKIKSNHKNNHGAMMSRKGEKNTTNFFSWIIEWA